MKKNQPITYCLLVLHHVDSLCFYKAKLTLFCLTIIVGLEASIGFFGLVT